MIKSIESLLVFLLLSIKKITRLGWKKETTLNKGLKKTYKWFLANQ